MSFFQEENDDEYEDVSTVMVRNSHLDLMDQDILYHLALGSGSHDLRAMFGDVKFVCMGGTPKRMEQFAYKLMEEISYKIPTGTTLQDISRYSYRYSMYKVGPVLCISHGMGMPSVGILLHETIKLMFHAKVVDPVFFRIGTSGGIGMEGGTVIISDEAVDGTLQPHLELQILGKAVKRSSILDKKLQWELKSLAESDDPYPTVIGKTVCTSDFYEGQGRMDGAFCDFTEEEKMEYLEKLKANGVRNIEMESLAFAALTHHAGIKAAVVCVTLLDRLKGDQNGITLRRGWVLNALRDILKLKYYILSEQIHYPKEVLDEWQQRPQKLVCRYIKKYLSKRGMILNNHCGSVNVKSPRRFKLVQQESESYD